MGQASGFAAISCWEKLIGKYNKTGIHHKSFGLLGMLGIIAIITSTAYLLSFQKEWYGATPAHAPKEKTSKYFKT